MRRRASIIAALALVREGDALPEGSAEEGAFERFLEARPGFVPAHAADLLLVSRCLQGDARALGTLERDFLRPLAPIVSAMEPAGAFVQDVLQELRLKLLGERRLAQYAGKGALQGWLRRAALNTAAHLRGHAPPADSLEAAPERVVADPELSFIKARYREAFGAAFRAALARLEPRERTVLRLHALAEVGIDELGQMYRVHRATAARWLQRARERVLALTREELGARLQLSDADAQELLQLLRSQLDVSLRRALAAEPSGNS